MFCICYVIIFCVKYKLNSFNVINKNGFEIKIFKEFFEWKIFGNLNLCRVKVEVGGSKL